MAKAQQSAKAKIPSILASLSDLGSLRKACAQHEVPKGTFLGWIAEDPALADQYARAREIGLEAMAEEILDISDESGVDVFLDKETGKWAVNGEAVARARLRTDNRKWLLSKCLPKKYGDALKLTGDPTDPLNVTITRRVIQETKP